jgi:3-oxoacyl-[acyl-carrier protein] reductase/cyclopentanol dehydrogenase/dihydroanticapsin dehydrogenase
MAMLDGKTAVISGASGGMGRVACARFCEEGARVVGVDIDEQGGQSLADELATLGHEFRFVGCDVASSVAVRALADDVVGREGAVDILYNNAGIVLAKSLADTTDEDWDRVLDVNLKSVFLMARAFAPHLRAGGSMVNVGSIGGISAFENLVAYGPAKAGVAQLTRVLAVALGPDVRVNAICPGHTDTPMPRAFAQQAPDPEAVIAHMAADTVLRRLGTPEEVVNLALWLSCDAASYMTGSVITIDGGCTLN